MGRRFDESKLDLVAEALARMESDWSIERRLANEYKVTTKRVRTWIMEVRRRWAERDAAMTLDDRRAHLTAMWCSLYAEARRGGHTNAARECLRDIGRLWGLTTGEVNAVVNVYDRGGGAALGQAITDRVRELREQKRLAAGTDDENKNGSN